MKSPHGARELPCVEEGSFTFYVTGKLTYRLSKILFAKRKVNNKIINTPISIEIPQWNKINFQYNQICKFLKNISY